MTFDEINNQRNRRAPRRLSAAPAWSYRALEPGETMYQVLHHQFVASALAGESCASHYPEMKSAVCWRWCRPDPYCCNPDDATFAQESMRNATSLPMCSYAAITRPMSNEWERRGFNIKMEDGDLDVLRVKAPAIILFQLLHDQRSEGRRRHRRCDLRFEGSVPNPYVKASTRGWQIDPEVCAMPFANCMSVIRGRC
ncbi:hypothetical protein ACNKHX_17510 [Shigella flexneri]